MEYCFYELNTAPDFSLQKYASLSETGPKGVLVQQQAFWRQINQWGKMYGGAIHFIYEFNPLRREGERLKLVLRFDSPSEEGKISIEQIMEASVMAPYYEQLVPTGDRCLSKTTYAFQANLIKRERFIESSGNENEKYYTVSEWEMGDEARLYSLLKMMEVMKEHCAYCVSIYPVDYVDMLDNVLMYILPHLRELNSFSVKKSYNAVSSGGRDENAKKALDFYEDLQESIASSPHFLVNIQSYGQYEGSAKQLLDAAASEAISEGSHLLITNLFNGSIYDGLSQGFVSWSDPNVDDNMAFLPHLLTAEEMAPFAVFPVLYPGENLEMPKETVPPPQDGLLIGKDILGHEIFLPWKHLTKHAFLAGMPGSGKTNTIMYLVSEIYKAGIPVLVLEPAKKEYRVLTTLPEMKEISLFSPCANSMFPIHINPFEFPIGMKLADHINRLLDVFNGTFELDPPFPMLLTEGIQTCYEQLMWLPGMINMGELEYPTMSMLYAEIDKLLGKYKYGNEVRDNLKSVLQVRIGSLMAREMGDIFDVPRSTYRPEEWLQKSAVIELASLGTAPSNFMILMLMTLIREVLDIKAYEPGPDKKPRHVIFLEEAHNLIANTSVQEGGKTDPKISATAYITKMLAEVRALGEGIVIADQLPTAMAPEVVKNTSLKIGLRLTSQDERELLGSTMSADGVQMEKMGVFTPGHCLVSYEDLLKPFEMQTPEFKDDRIVNDTQLLDDAIPNQNYHYNMYESASIMRSKFEKRKTVLDEKVQTLITEATEILQLRNELRDKGRLTDTVTDVEKEKQFEKTYREKEAQYRELMEAYCRFVLDVLMYDGTSVIREERVKRMHFESPEAKSEVLRYITQWQNSIHDQLYMESRSARIAFRTEMKKRGIKELSDLEEKLITQQKLIMKSWG